MNKRVEDATPFGKEGGGRKMGVLLMVPIVGAEAEGCARVCIFSLFFWM